jgi:N-methylhydantoinase A
LTTPSDPGEGAADVVVQLLDQIAAPGAATAVKEVVHGTTLVTNTILERKGAKTGLIITEGCADVLDIRRELRYDLYDLALELPDPLIPRNLRVEIAERMGAGGAPIRAVTDSEINRVCAALEHLKLDGVAVCLLHSHVNSTHEEQVHAHIARRLPELSVCISSRIAREIREYERMSTTVANAYVQPLMERYLKLLEGRLAAAGILGHLRIMLSSGGFTSVAAAAEAPILLLESGPAAGVLSAINTGRETGVGRILAFDMGGTTAKASVARDGAPDVGHTFETGRVKRFKRGSGLPILIPSVELIEIGAGGGSIASINALGLLKVGPHSAGAVPGPACYGRGGQEATVTDADLLLGYLDASNFLGGEMALSTDDASRVVQTLADRLGLSETETAWGIVNIVNENMAAAARVHIAEKGLDPRSFTMVATGGAGPVHAAEVARKLRIKRLLCPIAAGAGSCLGLLAAPARTDRAWSRPQLLSRVDWQEARQMLAALHEDAARELRSTHVRPDAVDWSLLVEMRYAGQGSTVGITLPYSGAIGQDFANVLADGFADKYRQLYGDTVVNGAPEVVTWRLTGKSRTSQRRFSLAKSGEKGSRDARFRQIYLPLSRAFESVPVYDRYALPAGSRLIGPLVLEEREFTLVLPFAAHVTILDDLTVSANLEDLQ